MAATAITQSRVKRILTELLRLRDPRFVLETVGGMVGGSVISESFHRKDDLDRQRMIRDALAAALGSQAGKVGTLLAYTPEEWDVDLEATSHRKKKAG